MLFLRGGTYLDRHKPEAYCLFIHRSRLLTVGFGALQVRDRRPIVDFVMDLFL